MSKTLSAVDKQTIAGLTLIGAAVLLFLINGILVVPGLISTFGPAPKEASTKTIDASALGQAVKLLQGE